MRKSLLIALTFSFLAGCLGPEVNELDFFEVALYRLEHTPELGSLRLSGTLSEADDVAIEEHGFIWAETVSDLENLTSAARWITLPGAPENATFDAIASGFALDSIYYFQAYAMAGERRARSSIASFSLGVNVGISRETFIENDSAVLTGFIQGLQRPEGNISVSEHGFVLSKTNTFPEYGADDTLSIGALNDDGLFRATARNLDFNQLYYARAFVKPQGLPPYYSDTLTFQMADGWSEKKELGLPIYYASSVSMSGRGYVVFGCFDEDCLNRSNKLWEYIPETDQWNEKAPFDGSLPTRYNATAFAIRDTLYVGFGKDPDLNSGIQGYARNFYWIAPNGSNTWTELTPQPPMDRREGAFAFVIDNKAYIGGGLDKDGNARNDFWQYDPDARTWKPMAGLWANNPNPEYLGRFGSVAFSINGKGYVGGGALQSLEVLRGLWAFTPPLNPQDTGLWQFHSDIPGRERLDAIGFTIGEKGYIGGGELFRNSFYLDDFWEFDPTQDGDAAWAAATRIRQGGRARAFSFAIGEKGYIGGGEIRALDENNRFFSIILKSLWAYTPRQ